jgi:hypothetical protein
LEQDITDDGKERCVRSNPQTKGENRDYRKGPVSAQHPPRKTQILAEGINQAPACDVAPGVLDYIHVSKLTLGRH